MFPEIQILPVQGYKSPFEHGFWIFLRHMVLPTMTLSVIYIALIARMTRASVQEILQEDYVRTARAKGQSEFKILMRHALRNAAVPIVTVISLATFGVLWYNGYSLSESIARAIAE